MRTDRRRFERVRLRQPIRGVVGTTRIYVLDTSVTSLRVAHQAALPPPGQFCRVELPTEVGPIKLDCEVVRTTSADQLFHTALWVVAADRQSTERLRSLFTSLRAFREN